MKLKLVARQDAILKNFNKEITVTIESPFLIPATNSQAESIINDDDPFRSYVLYVLDRQINENNYREVYASDSYPEDDAVSTIYDTYYIQDTPIKQNSTPTNIHNTSIMVYHTRVTPIKPRQIKIPTK
jgi:hypothetical protein